MSFFDGINTNQNTFEHGGDFPLIPKGTRVVATCEEAKNDSYNGENYINLKWRINLPQEYANRVIFQKLKVYDPDRQKTAREMLAAIAANAGGRLFQVMTAGNEQMPSDASLQTLCNSPMVLQLDVWELDDKSKSGNWVRSVAPYSQQQAPAAAPVTPQPAAPQSAPAPQAAPAPQPAPTPAPVVQQPTPAVAPAPLDEIPF